MKEIDIERSIKCTTNLCNIILEDVIKLFESAENADVVNEKTVALIKNIASERKMILHQYDERALWFTIFHEEAENYMTVSINFVKLKGENTIYVELASNLDSEVIYGAKH